MLNGKINENQLYQLVQDFVTTIHVVSTSYVSAPPGFPGFPHRQPLLRAAPHAEAVLPSWPTPSKCWGAPGSPLISLGEGTGYGE